jgi:hypothetical protein
MIRRRLFILALAAFVLALTAGQSAAQTIVGPIGPGGLLYSSTATVNASGQVATAQTLFSQSLSASLLRNSSGHLAIKGNLSTAASSAGTLTVACTYGNTTLTIASALSLTTNLASNPVWIDLWILPNATGGLSKALHGSMRHVATGTTLVANQARTTGTLTGANNQSLSCTATFSDVTIATGIIVESATLNVGS